MANVAQQWGRRALDFVDAVERLNAPGVIQLFEAEIKACGFHAYIMAGLPSPGTSLSDLTVANGWPPEWFELYTRENFSVMDPVPKYGASTVQPFEWSEAHYDKESNPAAHLVMTRAAEFRLMEGYCIPLHYDEGGAVISMATEQLNIDPVAKSALQLIGVYAHNRIRSLGRPTSERALDGPRTRSPALGGRRKDLVGGLGHSQDFRAYREIPPDPGITQTERRQSNVGRRQSPGPGPDQALTCPFGQ